LLSAQHQKHISETILFPILSIRIERERERQRKSGMKVIQPAAFGGGGDSKKKVREEGRKEV